MRKIKMSHSESRFEKILESFTFDKKTIGYFFLGVGFTMFILNVVTIVNFMKFEEINIPLTGYYISIICSIFLMTYSVYNIYDNN